MSVSIDGARATVSQYQLAELATDPERYLSSAAFSSLLVFEIVHNSPMPHSIFFHRGYAIHGSYDINRLGGPASHGCIRLHPANAAALFDLVRSEGVAATTIVVSGATPSSRASFRVIASASSPKETPAHDDRSRREYGPERPAYDDRYPS